MHLLVNAKVLYMYVDTFKSDSKETINVPPFKPNSRVPASELPRVRIQRQKRFPIKKEKDQLSN